MALIDRVKNIIISPKTEWDVIAGETTAPKDLILGYVLPLAGAAAIASFIGSVIFVSLLGGMLGASFGVVGAAVGAIIHVVMAVVSVFVLGFIIDALAPTFGGQKNLNQALKLTAYSYTPAWVFGLAAIIPFLGSLAALIGGIYGLYVLYLGLPKLMRNPEEKSVPYLVVVIIAAIVLWMVIAFITAATMGLGALGAAAVHGSSPSYDRGSSTAKLNEFARKMEEAGKKMEAAQKSGDPNKAMEASMAALGTAISGGKGVEPVSLDQLKPFLPENFAGLPRTDMRTERGGVTGLMMAKVEGSYGDSAGKTARLEVSDTGGAAGLMGLAAWMNVQGEREDANRREVTKKEGGRFVHEEVSKTGGTNKYTVIVADRYVVNAQGSVDIGTLKSGVASLDLGKLESMKDATAPKQQ
jgi:hypothetical protein